MFFFYHTIQNFVRFHQIVNAKILEIQLVLVILLETPAKTLLFTKDTTNQQAAIRSSLLLDRFVQCVNKQQTERVLSFSAQQLQKRSRNNYKTHSRTKFLQLWPEHSPCAGPLCAPAFPPSLLASVPSLSVARHQKDFDFFRSLPFCYCGFCFSSCKQRAESVWAASARSKQEM